MKNGKGVLGIAAWLSTSAALHAQEFTPAELEALHPRVLYGTYHDVDHSRDVAEIMFELTGDRFLAQVALLHDIDPNRTPGMPARVPATLEWMGRHRTEILRRFGWTPLQFDIAKALIQRTEFPFDDHRRASSYRDAYKEISPVGRLREMLRGLNPFARFYVLQNGAILSEYADKASNGTNPFPTALRKVEGLARELRNAGAPVSWPEFSKSTFDFLRSIGTPESFAVDRALAEEFGIRNLRIPLREEAMARLSAAHRANFENNLHQFGEIQEGRLDPRRVLRSATLRRETGAAVPFILSYLLKESLVALETGDPQRIRTAAGRLREAGFWGDLAAFTVAARTTEWGIAKLPLRGSVRNLSRMAVPLAAGMAAVQLLSGRFSLGDLLLDTGAFLAAGAFVSFLADGLIYPALFSAGPPGWLAAGVYTVAKLTATLYLGEKLGAWLRGRPDDREPRSDRWGIQQKIDRLP